MALYTRGSEMALHTRELILDTQYTPLGSSDRMWEQRLQITSESERTHGILFTFPVSVHERELCPGTCLWQSWPPSAVTSTAHYKVNVTLCLPIAKMI